MNYNVQYFCLLKKEKSPLQDFCNRDKTINKQVLLWSHQNATSDRQTDRPTDKRTDIQKDIQTD